MGPRPKYENIQYAGKPLTFTFIGMQELGNERIPMYTSGLNEHTLSGITLDVLLRQQSFKKCGTPTQRTPEYLQRL